MPGTDDEVLLGEETVNRLLCDADVTRVLTTTAATPARAADAPADDTATTYLDAVVTTLEAMARSVLYVGYAERTVTALEALVLAITAHARV